MTHLQHLRPSLGLFADYGSRLYQNHSAPNYSGYNGYGHSGYPTGFPHGCQGQMEMIAGPGQLIPNQYHQIMCMINKEKNPNEIASNSVGIVTTINASSVPDRWIVV